MSWPGRIRRLTVTSYFLVILMALAAVITGPDRIWPGVAACAAAGAILATVYGGAS